MNYLVIFLIILIAITKDGIFKIINDIAYSVGVGVVKMVSILIGILFSILYIFYEERRISKMKIELSKKEMMEKFSITDYKRTNKFYMISLSVLMILLGICLYLILVDKIYYMVVLFSTVLFFIFVVVFLKNPFITGEIINKYLFS